MHKSKTQNNGTFCTVDEAYKQAELPSINSWPDISAEQANYRKYVLDQIANRVSQDGIRTCKSSATRAKQFMPYAALTGYGNVVKNVANENAKIK